MQLILVLMIVGAVIYTYGDLQFTVVRFPLRLLCRLSKPNASLIYSVSSQEGYAWAFANLSCTIAAGMFGKAFSMGLKVV